MEVKAIQGLSLMNQNAGSLKKSDNHSAVKNYAQMDAPMSKNAAEAIKNNSMISFGERKKSNAMKSAVVATAIGMAAPSAMTSCSPIKVEAESWSDSYSDAKAWAWAISDCPCNNKPDTIKTVIHDSIPYIVHDSIPVVVHDSIPVVVHDTIPGDTVYLPGDTIWQTKTDTIYKDRVDTVYKDRIDTVFQTKIDTLHFKDYPFHIADSLIAHGLNNGFKLNGPEPTSTNNNIVFLASSCYNRYDQKMYQTYAVDDPDANTSKMATLITRVTDLYDKNNPKVSYIKSVVTDVPGKGIQFEYTQIPENRVSSIEAQDNEYLPSPFDYRFMQAGKEIHTNLRNGTNRVTILNSKGEEEWRGDFKKGQLPQTFFFQTFARDPRTGEVYYDENGNPEQAKYDFSNGQMISRAVEWTEYQPGYVKPNLH